MNTQMEIVSTSASNSCTLYELEDTLQALVDSIVFAEEALVRDSILEEIGLALRKTKEKRDSVVAFLKHCEQQLKFADAEIERIERRKTLIARIQEQLESYVIQIIEQFAPADRRGVQRLEGHFSSMRIQKNPDSVVVTDEKALPVTSKDIVLTMPAYAWEALLGRLGADDRMRFEKEVKKSEFKSDKRAIAAELKRGVEIPGADLRFGELRLVID